MKFLHSFFSSIKSEFEQITWPTKKETIKLVKVVIVFSLLVAIFLGFADFGFSFLLQRFILNI